MKQKNQPQPHNRFYNSFVRSTILLLTLFSYSCHEKREAKVLYYNIDSLMLAQGNYLATLKAKLTKEVSLSAITDTTLISPDSAEWQAELDIFRQLDVMNKSIKLKTYTVEDGPDAKSNLNLHSFICDKNLPMNDQNKLFVKNLKIYYQDSPSKPRRIEALYQEENSLFKNSRILTMEFQNINDKTVLTSYSIQGGQKMFLGDSVEFSLKGKITIR